MLRKKLVLLFLSLIFIFSQSGINPENGYASVNPMLEQGSQYMQGDYDPTAEQPTPYNWNRISSFNGIEKNPYKKWTYKPNQNPAEYSFKSSPVIDSDGTIYVVQNSFNNGSLLALNKDGSLKWKFDTFQQASFQSPVISNDGTILFATTNGLYAVDKNKNMKWFYAIGTPATPAISNDGKVYFTRRGKELTALDLKTGTVIWRTPIDDYCDGTPAIGSDGTIYLAITGGEYSASFINAYNSDGSVKWKYRAPSGLGNHIGYGSPTISNDGSTIYVGNKDKNLYAINTSDGTLKWKFATGRDGRENPVVDKNGTIYFGSDKFYALNPDGTVKWTFTISNYGIMGTPIMDASGNIYFKTYDNIYCLDNNGNLKWKLNPAEDMSTQSSMAMGSDGTLYMSGYYSSVIAIGGEQEFTICEKANYLDTLIESGLDTQEKVDNAKAELEILQQKVQEYQTTINEAELNLTK